MWQQVIIRRRVQKSPDTVAVEGTTIRAREVSNVLHENVFDGDLLRVARPFGDLVLDHSTTPLLLISTGIGYTPMAGTLHHLSATKATPPISALHADRRCIGNTLAAAGSALGVLAGIIQATVGASIPYWTGAKASPGALGALTVVLSLVAAAGCAMSRRPHFGGGGRLVAVVALVLPALVCFTTVGRLWIVPGPLLLIGATLSIGSWSEAADLTRRNWIRVLLASLGGFEKLMAAGATPVVMAVGVAGGAALIAGAWAAGQKPVLAGALIALGTVPFAALTWMALVPVLLLLVAVALATTLFRQAAGPVGPLQPSRIP